MEMMIEMKSEIRISKSETNSKAQMTEMKNKNRSLLRASAPLREFETHPAISVIPPKKRFHAEARRRGGKYPNARDWVKTPLPMSIAST